MISYKTIKQNSRLTQFAGTRELVIRNTVPKTTLVRPVKEATQSNLFQF